MPLGRHKKRDKILLEYVKDKDCLDLGSYNHGLGTTQLYDFLKANAESVQGSDIMKTDLPELIQVDAENIGLKERYSVVVAGELIEHLTNPSKMLDGVKKVLKDDGVFILTTPNAVSPYYYLFAPEPGIGHTCWFTPHTLKELFQRCGWEIVRVEYYSRQTNNPLNWLFQLWCKIIPRTHLHILVVAKVTSGNQQTQPQQSQ